MALVDPNRLGTGKWILCDMVGIIPTITLLLALCIGARGLGSYQNIWKYIVWITCVEFLGRNDLKII